MSQLKFLHVLPKTPSLLGLKPKETIVVVDRKVLKAVPRLKTWLEKFPFRFSLEAGEELKSLESYTHFIKDLQGSMGEEISPSWTVLAIGGGSLGDFAGFFASTYKRGLKLIHVPSTWLAAIDSSHGGKTALNFNGVKNQIGTFYQADKTILIRELLLGAPAKLAYDALGELVKIAIIDGGSWAKKLNLHQLESPHEVSRVLWKTLPFAIRAKLRVVKKDPLEKIGHRHVLNLGHTMGHVIESGLGFTHGKSVWLGLQFAVGFSISEGYLKKSSRFHQWFQKQDLPSLPRGPILMELKKARRLLGADKKRLNRGKIRFVRFVFIEGLGKAKVVPTKLDSIIKYGINTGWFR